ncbi:MAG: hypothetical protein K6E85_13735 [Lachnospiraceae bacterium]|nr:hypothetical protein [Lachnospiraceae bacterium]
MNDKLRKIVIFLGAVAAAAGLFGAGMAFGAGGAEPGSQGDPIVTLSYLDSRLAALGVENDRNAGQADTSGNGSAGNAVDAGFSKLTLTKGQSIALSDGGMLIVYSGNGRIGGEGMLNLSTDEMFESGNSAVLYTVFMATGNDGCVDALGNMTVYVMGRYELK